MITVWIFSFFFCKQKTAYEVRISDWSSDVCSSDLPAGAIGARGPKSAPPTHPNCRHKARDGSIRQTTPLTHKNNTTRCKNSEDKRSEERRVGTECGSTCRSRWSPDH